ncbi:MAG TPA: RAMP superfamily CRISPR-associated protein [Blastocatellia bacterium]|nr:RAMP superfamily CRISPR-associated protein [Blastocatellia bacterium]
MRMEIHLKLTSDATFGRGDGVAGLIDSEVEHDEYGLPYLRGRTLKGLLVEECANILYALQGSAALSRFESAAQFLFGKAGSTLSDDALMRVGAALLPEELRQAVRADIKAIPPRLTPDEVLQSLTAIRRQTTVDDKTGAPEKNSLRSLRVILRETVFIARLDFDRNPDDEAKALLAACVMSLRRAGTGRNRGRGRLESSLCDAQGNDVSAKHFNRFKSVITANHQGVAQ